MQLIMPMINPKAINIIINSRATPLLGNNPVTSVAVALFTSVLIRELAAVFDTVDATPLIALIAFQPVLLLDEKRRDYTVKNATTPIDSLITITIPTLSRPTSVSVKYRIVSWNIFTAITATNIVVAKEVILVVL